MLTQFAHMYPYGLIRYSQTTFLELITDNEVHRIDFVGKLSYRLQRGTHGPVSFHDEHPMLTTLHVPLTSLMALATIKTLSDAPALLEAIRKELYPRQEKWFDFHSNSWTKSGLRLSSFNVRPDLTRTGGIILDMVPVPVAQDIAAICTRYGVETYYLPPLRQLPLAPPTSPFRLLTIGQNYVIARDFCVSTLF